MDQLIKEIGQADSKALDTILKAVLQRYTHLFPDWEVITISLKKASDRNEQLDRMVAALEKMKHMK